MTILTTALQATVEENIINVPPGARMTLAGYHCLVAGWTLDECEAHLRAGLDADVWFIYRGGSHIAVHYRPFGCERVWIVREERLTSDECPQCSRIGAGPLCKAHRPEPEDTVFVNETTYYAPDDRRADYDERNAEWNDDAIAVPTPGGRDITDEIHAAAEARRIARAQTPPVAAPEGLGTTKAHADDAPTVAPAIAAGDDVDVFVNQATREGWVLAVLGDEYILEYTMPKGTTALQIRRVDGGSIKDGKWNGSYRSVSYTSLSRKWLQAIVDAGSVWEGKAQGVYKVWNDRFGSSGNSYHRVPSAADLLAKKAVR